MEEAQRIFELAGAVILSTGAGGTIVFGLSNWLGKLWAERIFQAERVRYEEYLKGIQHQLNSEIESIRSENQRKIFVHKVQFETEFSAYKEIWSYLSIVVSRTLALRPIMDSIDPTESEHERKNRRLWEWNESMQDFFKAVRDNRPFLPASVISQVDSLMVTMRDEALNYEQFSEKSDTTYDYWDSQKENSERIKVQSNEVCDAIRERIGLLEIISPNL